MLCDPCSERCSALTLPPMAQSDKRTAPRFPGTGEFLVTRDRVRFSLTANGERRPRAASHQSVSQA